ncbi:uncharacterized protein LOC108484796 [Gossypium arboreum]|uniref:uncharacterized protein LOC108484796 n=1 Tax=Gossypium arboreum TaxID=29729 RepID=UPI000819424C|nr:uncharacterized protein LOC108484796 [Gossypium arboreum]
MAEELIIPESDMKIFDDMGEAYAKLLANDTHGLEEIFRRNNEALFHHITVSRDTVFHIAAYKGCQEMLRTLLNLVKSQTKKREVLKMKNVYGNTVFHELVTTANSEAADLLMKEVLFSDGRPLNHENDIREREEILADRNNLGETPLFRAAEYGNMSMVKYLATQIIRMGGNLHKHYTRDDGLSILHVAVVGQHFDIANWLMEKEPQLATYKDQSGKTSLHLLASMGNAFESSSIALGIFKELIYYCLPHGSCHGHESNELPLDSQKKYLEQGEASKARNQPERSNGTSKLYCGVWRCLAQGWNMIDRMWKQKKMHASAVKLASTLVRTDTSWFDSHETEEGDTICLERKEGEKAKDEKSAASGIKSSSEPDTPLIIAASTGIVEIVKEILHMYPQAVEHISKTGQNILHVAILHRKYKVFNLVNTKEEAKRLVRGIDNDGCTILHHAADIKYYQGGTIPTPALELQQELKCFEAVKKKMPVHFTMHRNKNNMTADQLFKDMHKDQLKSAQEWVKNTSQSCSTVAVLVATVVFAAAYTAPGGFHPNGRPILLERPMYSFFTVMDVAGLASSLTSVVIFLSILTSSQEYQDFLNTVHRKLSLGFIFLFFSVTSTMLTFTATILLLVHLQKKWTATLTYAAAFLPICVFALFQFPLYYRFFIEAGKGILVYLRRNMPGYWEFLRIEEYVY